MAIELCKVELSIEQENLRKDVEENLKWIKENMFTKQCDLDSYQEKLKLMGSKAHELHMSLKEAGKEPKHHRYMIQNRGMKSDHKEFYYHIHPVEDLLAFIENIHANDDPEDITIGIEFKINVFSRRWGHDDTYTLKRIESGWDIRFISRGGESDKQGNPALFEILDADSINYPAALGEYLEFLWYQAEAEGLTEVEIQEYINKLGEWISITEKNSPKGIFEVYK